MPDRCSNAEFWVPFIVSRDWEDIGDHTSEHFWHAYCQYEPWIWCWACFIMWSMRKVKLKIHPKLGYDKLLEFPLIFISAYIFQSACLLGRLGSKQICSRCAIVCMAYSFCGYVNFWSKGDQICSYRFSKVQLSPTIQSRAFLGNLL